MRQKNRLSYWLCLLACLCWTGCQAFAPDWSKDASLPETGSRGNVYQMGDADWDEAVSRGLQHTLIYPVSVTGLLVPYTPYKKIIETPSFDSIEKLLFGQSFETIGAFYAWLGLSPFSKGAQALPFPQGQPDNILMGAGIIERRGAKGVTFSCAACHTGRFFGKPIVGLGVRRPRANEIFFLGKQLEGLGFQAISSFLGGMTDAEAQELKTFLANLKSVGVQRPKVLGLDTSLAQVALSLARREADAYATKSDTLAANPRALWPKDFVADSKPMVWWTMKYKTRWLADGSIISGNPVFTNFLWNELGRGADLKALALWLEQNQGVVRDLTAAVFATKAPRYGDFFGWESIDLEQAKQGQALFEARCAKCHGSYDKGWDDPTKTSLAEKMQTTRVRYPAQTQVHDVGTDPNRYTAMGFFADALNQLAISQQMKTVVEPQKGYVPPPLTGLFARYPYMHNNAIPNLCALLTPSAQRPKLFYHGPAVDKARDVDLTCMGYPTGDAIPESWKQDESARFDTSQPGLSNKGHDIGIFIDEQGKSLLSETQKMQLIAYLKTL